MKDYKIDKDVYFGHLTDDEYLDSLYYRIDKHYDFLDEKLNWLHNRAYVAYYGGDLNKDEQIFDSARIKSGGKADEKSQCKANHYRNLVKHSVSLATANKPALSAVSTNTDYKSQSQTILAEALLDYYINTLGIAEKVRKATEYSCILGEGWIHLPWEPDEGEEYGVENGKPVYTGDLKATYHHIQDVIRDVTRKNTDFKWLILRDEVNKFDLAAKYPDLEEKIINISYDEHNFSTRKSFRSLVTDETNDSDSECINVFTLYHDRTPALPNGRLTVFAGDSILFDGELPYKEIPLVPVMPDVLHQSAFGYSPFNDLIGLQQAQDNLMATVLSNNLTFGTQHIWQRTGSQINVDQLEGGLTIIESDEKPEPIQLTQSSPETYNLISMMQGMQETLSGISSTVRGNPEKNLKSGAALALVVAQSVQFGSGLENSYNEMLTRIGNLIISHLKQFAEQPRMATIVGKSKQPMLKEYTKDDISDVKRVQVQQVSALSKTISGRVELATQLMQMPPEKARQYMNIVNTGQLPDDMQITPSILSIKQENEKLQSQEDVPVIWTEHHLDHIKTHMELLNSPEAKQNPELITTVTIHIQKHIDEYRKLLSNPDNLKILSLIHGEAFMQGMPQAQVPKPPQMGPAPVQGPESASLPNMPNAPQNTDPNSKAAYEQYLANLPK